MWKKIKDFLLFLLIIIGIPVVFIVGNSITKFGENVDSSNFDYFFLIVVGIGFYLFSMKLIKDRTINLTNPYLSKILQIAYTYLFIIIVFGIVYFKIYLKNANSFVITNGIIQAQKANESIEATYSEMKELNTKILLLNKLNENSEAAFPAFIKNRKYYENGESVEDLDSTVPFLKVNDIDLKLYAKYLGDSTINPLGILTISFDKYNQIFVDEALIPERENYITGLFFSINLSDFRNNILKKITYYTSEISKLNKSLATKINRNNSIGLIDFIYFSSITTTTIGYGDIIPNTTLVRIIVIIHSSFSVLFLAFAGLLVAKKET